MLEMKGEACRNTVGLLLLCRDLNAGRGCRGLPRNRTTRIG
jgi:hypothetical protein